MDLYEGGFYGTLQLDDGHVIPETVSLFNEKYDKENRTFVFEIHWQPSTIKGVEIERHHFKFSDH